MANVDFMYRADIGFSKELGYLCELTDVQASNRANQKLVKVVRGNSIEQLASRLRHVLIEETGKRRRFPLESEPAAPATPSIITPETGDPFFNQV